MAIYRTWHQKGMILLCQQFVKTNMNAASLHNLYDSTDNAWKVTYLQFKMQMSVSLVVKTEGGRRN
jgi:hypothetical protein